MLGKLQVNMPVTLSYDFSKEPVLVTVVVEEVVASFPPGTDSNLQDVTSTIKFPSVNSLYISGYKVFIS